MSEDLVIQMRFEDGCYWATVDTFPGVFATGDNVDELRESLEEGIALYIAKDGERTPRVEIARFEPEPIETSVHAGLALA